jgi:phosphorylcholine metabolism protein LicD
MLDPVPAKLNRRNLVDITKLLKDIDHCVFFGTLLGLNREGDIIKNDDDIDFLLEMRHRAGVINILKDSQFDIDLTRGENSTPFFLQATRPQDHKVISRLTWISISMRIRGINRLLSKDGTSLVV